MSGSIETSDNSINYRMYYNFLSIDLIAYVIRMIKLIVNLLKEAKNNKQS